MRHWDWTEWFLGALMAMCVVLMIVCFVGLGCSIYQAVQDQKNCEKWQRTLVNVPSHLVGKFFIPESVREGQVCVKWRDGSN